MGLPSGVAVTSVVVRVARSRTATWLGGVVASPPGPVVRFELLSTVNTMLLPCALSATAGAACAPAIANVCAAAHPPANVIPSPLPFNAEASVYAPATLAGSSMSRT